MSANFYPRPARRATLVFGVTVGICKFLSTPSARRATSRRLCAGTGQAILSTPSARRATTSFHFCVTLVLISIHALREEGDCPLNGPASPASRFLSTPSARATSGAVTIAAVAGFLSTPSARRATLYNLDPRPGRMDFYPRPPRGGRRAVLPGAELPRRTSIHALREEGDLYFWPFVSR